MPTPWGRRAAKLAQRTPMALVADDDPVLHQPAEAIRDFDDPELDLLVHRMLATCVEHNGIAIAAPQVGVPIQLVVVLEEHGAGAIMCNPVIKAGGRLIYGGEGCLSIPGKVFHTPRREYAVVAGQDLNGEPFGVDATGFKARVWQHEVDHLAGETIGRFPVLEAPQAATETSGLSWPTG